MIGDPILSNRKVSVFKETGRLTVCHSVNHIKNHIESQIGRHIWIHIESHIKNDTKNHIVWVLHKFASYSGS